MDDQDRDPETGQFVRGKKGGPGRPKGSRNKLGEAFIEDLYAAWKDRGPAIIDDVIENKPDVMLRVIAGLLPSEVKITRPEDEMSEEQMQDALDTISRLIAHRNAGSAASPTHRGSGTA